MFKKFKKLFIVLFAALLIIGVAKNADALYGLEKYWGSVVDTDENVITAISSVSVYTIDTTTLATVYSDNKGTSLTNPITTGLTDGVFEFWGSASSYDIEVTDGSRTTRIDSWTRSDAHRILLIQQVGEKKVLKFLPMDFILTDEDNSTQASLIEITKDTTPGLEIENQLVCLVWADDEHSYAQVTFKVPTDYADSGAFKALVDYDTGSAASNIDYGVWVNSDGSTWDTTSTIQTPVDPAGTAGKPELVNLPIATDFATLAADEVVTFHISRERADAGTADLELYYVEFYYDAKE